MRLDTLKGYGSEDTNYIAEGHGGFNGYGSGYGIDDGIGYGRGGGNGYANGYGIDYGRGNLSYCDGSGKG